MQFIASTAALRALHTQSSVVSGEMAELKDINLGPSFYNKARVKQPSVEKKLKPKQSQRSGLLVTLILLGCLISGTEIFLLVNKLTTNKTPQVVEVTQTNIITERTH